MGLNDRPYWKEPPPYRDGGGNVEFKLDLPRPSRVVSILMIVCGVVFIAQIFSESLREMLWRDFGLVPARAYGIWRFITFQFLHGGARHIMFNMLALYFFGPPLERSFGARKFIVFYLFCGIFGGLCYLLMALIWPIFLYIPIIGASAGIMGCLMGCAILFPQFRIIVIPIRWVAVFYVILFVLSTAHDKNLSDAAHLGGMVAAIIWIWAIPKLKDVGATVTAGMNEGAWQRKMQQRADRQAEIDRVLDKIRDEGIASLTDKEKKILQDATKQQQKEERESGRL